MIDGMMKHLKSQLAAKGIDSPESLPKKAPVELSNGCLTEVAGGDGIIVAFGQYFDQLSAGPYTQTIYTQYFGP